MSDIAQTASSDSMIHIAGGIAIICGILSAVGVVTLIGMYVCFATQNTELGLRIGMLNDISAAVQYLLTIPIALALYRILLVY